MGIRRMIQTYLHTSHALRVLPWTKLDLFSHIVLNHKWWLLVAWVIIPNLTNMATGLKILHFVQQPIIIFHIVGYLSIYLFLSMFLFSYPFPALDSYVVSSFSFRYKRKITRERERDRERERQSKRFFFADYQRLTMYLSIPMKYNHILCPLCPHHILNNKTSIISEKDILE